MQYQILCVAWLRLLEFLRGDEMYCNNCRYGVCRDYGDYNLVIECSCKNSVNYMAAFDIYCKINCSDYKEF